MPMHIIVHTIMFVVLLVLLLADYLQTVYIASHSDKWKELNPILGEHPPTRKVSIYFGLVFAAMLVLAIALKEHYWEIVIGIGIITESIVVTRNYMLGIKFR